jgi:hypothetical protein
MQCGRRSNALFNWAGNFDDNAPMLFAALALLPAALPRLPSALTFIPWLVPGVLLSAVIGLVVAGPLGRALRAATPIAWLLVVSVGTIVSATLTPIPGPLEQTGSCDFQRVGLIPLSLLLRPNEASLNVLLFVPLGFSIGLLPWTRRTAWLVAGAVALPLAIEIVQSLVIVLGRGCQSADVFDNLTGLLIGLGIGTTLHLLASPLRPGTGTRP